MELHFKFGAMMRYKTIMRWILMRLCRPLLLPRSSAILFHFLFRMCTHVVCIYIWYRFGSFSCIPSRQIKLLMQTPLEYLWVIVEKGRRSLAIYYNQFEFLRTHRNLYSMTQIIIIIIIVIISRLTVSYTHLTLPTIYSV